MKKKDFDISEHLNINFIILADKSTRTLENASKFKVSPHHSEFVLDMTKKYKSEYVNNELFIVCEYESAEYAEIIGKLNSHQGVTFKEYYHF